jgi:hypothetical protein
MEKTQSTVRSSLWRRAFASSLLVAVPVLAGCGTSNSYKNDLRPPAPINVTASISSKGVAVSPSSFGAGPIVLIVTNQTGASQEVTIESDTLGARSGGVIQTTEPINPQGTGQLKVDVSEGSYRVRAANATIRPATITVGPKRASAQNQVLQP